MKRLAVLAVTVLTAVPLFAQQQPKRDFEIFVYTSNVGLIWDQTYGTTIAGSYGAAVSKFVAPHVSLELAANAQDWYEYQPGPYSLGDPIVRYRQTSYPISLDGRYHFFTDSRWKPYLGGGVRYVNPHERLRTTGTRVTAEIVGGVSFVITPSLSLRFDGKQETQTRGPAYDPPSRVSFGLGWHF
jgi:Outer membrane protein beta-barrel domain